MLQNLSMALISCPDCSREVSDRAISCPSCGFPITELSHASASQTASDHHPALQPGACYSCSLSDRTSALSHILLTERVSGSMDGTIEGKIKTINHGRGLNWMGTSFGLFRTGSRSSVSLKAEFDTETLSGRVKLLSEFLPELDESESAENLNNFLSQLWCDRCSRMAHTKPDSPSHGLEETSAQHLGPLFLRTPYARDVLEVALGSKVFFQKVTAGPIVAATDTEQHAYRQTYLDRLAQFLDESTQFEMLEERTVLDNHSASLQIAPFEFRNPVGIKGMISSIVSISEDIEDNDLNRVPARRMAANIHGAFITLRTTAGSYVQVQASSLSVQGQVSMLLANATRLATSQVSESIRSGTTKRAGKLARVLNAEQLSKAFGCTLKQAKDVLGGNTEIVPEAYRPLLEKML